MDAERAAPGFFGKLPSHGDFLTRRLPPELRLRFDDWLQGALLASRAALGDAWLPTWLSSPLWRFVAGAGVAHGQAWTGVMMPSHDRVGRCFPLLLLAPVAGAPSLRDCMTLHDDWYVRLEDVALSALEEGFALDGFDRTLLALGGPPPGGRAAAGQALPAGVYGAADLEALADSELDDGQSAWWTDGSPLVAPCLAVCDGLPAAAGFAALLDGRWAEHPWPQGGPRGSTRPAWEDAQ